MRHLIASLAAVVALAACETADNQLRTDKSSNTFAGPNEVRPNEGGPMRGDETLPPEAPGTTGPSDAPRSGRTAATSSRPRTPRPGTSAANDPNAFSNPYAPSRDGGTTENSVGGSMQQGNGPRESE